MAANVFDLFALGIGPSTRHRVDPLQWGAWARDRPPVTACDATSVTLDTVFHAVRSGFIAESGLAGCNGKCWRSDAIVAGLEAIAAAKLALRGQGRHVASRGCPIEAMRRTGRDIRAEYRETSRGGFAVSVPT